MIPRSQTQTTTASFSYILIPRFGPSYEQSTSVRCIQTPRLDTRGSARWIFLAKPVETAYYFNYPIKRSEIEHSISFDWPTFFVSSILFDYVRQSNSIVRLNSIKFNCVRLPNVRLDTPGKTWRHTNSFRQRGIVEGGRRRNEWRTEDLWQYH